VGLPLRSLGTGQLDPRRRDVGRNKFAIDESSDVEPPLEDAGFERHVGNHLHLVILRRERPIADTVGRLREHVANERLVLAEIRRDQPRRVDPMGVRPFAALRDAADQIADNSRTLGIEARGAVFDADWVMIRRADQRGVR
jgi:hypothetical protein